MQNAAVGTTEKKDTEKSMAVPARKMQNAKCKITPRMAY